ncbi:MAG: hypothetical protein HYX50_01800 [Chloroflexi bacterium]|nr:hypothetical protein [Chloroflexota bacterium]
MLTLTASHAGDGPALGASPPTLALVTDLTAAASPTVSDPEAQTLARALAAGLPVARGFVLAPDAMLRHLETTGGLADVRSLLRRATTAPTVELAGLSAEMQATVALGPAPALEADLRDAHERVGGGRMRVRWSASDDVVLAKDARAASRVCESPEAILAEVRALWAAVCAPDALRYALAANRDPLQGNAAMLVQVMRAADHAGRAWSIDPVTHRHDRVVVEAACGALDALERCETTPHLFAFDRETLELRERTAIGAGADAAQRAALGAAALMLRLEALFDAPHEMVWDELAEDILIAGARPTLHVAHTH